MSIGLALRFFFSGEVTLLYSDVVVRVDFIDVSLDDEVFVFFFLRVFRFGVIRLSSSFSQIF